MLSIARKQLFQHERHCYIAFIRKAFSTSSNQQKQKGDIRDVAIVGGGTMGSGIAQAFAQSGINVTVIDNDEYAQSCLLNIMKSLNILSAKKFPHEPRCSRKFITDILSFVQTTQSLEKGCENADLVIETVVEDLDIKMNLFKKIDSIAPKHTVFASNTSSFSIEDIGSLTCRQELFMGLHFFNPVWRMRAVEVIATEHTSKDAVDMICSLVKDIGKVPVKCKENKETAGFLVNSLLFPYLLEAVRFYERGHASLEDIDTAMKLGAALPAGPFELMDIIGIDNMKSISDRWHAKYPNNPKYFPTELINKLFVENKLGRKSGQGFYTYKPKNKLY